MFNRAIGTALVAGLLCCFGQSSAPSVLDLLSPDEFGKAGLTKLTRQERESLNASLIRIIVALGTNEKSSARASVRSTPSNDSELFDASGVAVAYFDDDQTLYLWSGEPVAYRVEDSLFGFNGNHIGWLHNSAVYDHDGGVVAASATRFREPVQPPPFKSFKQFKPFKNFKEIKPLRPVFGTSWSRIPARSLFLLGVK